MHSLTDLNGYGSTSQEFPDNRPATVVFDILPPLVPEDQDIEITTVNVTVNPSINMVEIINYATTDATYTITVTTGIIDPLSGSTIDWTSIPSHMTLTQVDDTYTLSGFKSAADWEAVKTFVWTLPADYASHPLWYLDVNIEYTDEALSQLIKVDWLIYDPRFYYISQMQSTSAMLTSGTRLIKSAASMTSVLTITPDVNYYKGILPQTLINEFTVTVSGVTNATNLIVNSVFEKCIPQIGSRSYYGNAENLLFPTDVLSDPTPSAAFEITLTCANGTFSTSSTVTPVSPLTISGTLSSINTQLNQVRFYPTKDYVSNTTMTFVLKKDSNILTSQTINLLGNAASAFTPVTYRFYTSQSFIPTNYETLYGGLADTLIIAGGGGGAGGHKGALAYTTVGVGGGAGGGGGVRYQTNIALSAGSRPYAVVVGLGGTGSAGYTGGQNAPTGTGSAGGDSSVFGYSCVGGLGGAYGTAPTTSNSTGKGGTGGNSGSPLSKTGFSPAFNTLDGGGGAGKVNATSSTGAQGAYLAPSLHPYSSGFGGGGGGIIGGAGHSSGNPTGGGLGGDPGQNGHDATSAIYSDGITYNLGGGGGGGGAGSRVVGSVVEPGAGGKGGDGMIIIKIHA